VFQNSQFQKTNQSARFLALIMGRQETGPFGPWNATDGSRRQSEAGGH
jgi:hypothetical protein